MAKKNYLIERKKLTQLLLLYSFFSALLVFGFKSYQSLTAAIAVIISVTAIICNLLSKNYQNWQLYMVSVLLNPFFLFLLCGIKLWDIKYEVDLIWYVLLILLFWMIYPLQLAFPEATEWIEEEIRSPKTVSGKILFRWMILIGVGGATLGRTMARSDTDISYFIGGLVCVFSAVLFQFTAVRSALRARQTIFKTMKR